MSGQAGARRLLLPGAIALAMFTILIGLGVWQLHRLTWKENLLTEIAAAQKAPPVPLGSQVPPRFARVVATGTLRASPVALYGAEGRDIGPAGVMGAQRLQILDRPGQAPVLVDVGWVPADPHVPAPPPQSGPASITGFSRPSEHAGWLSPPDDPEGHRFYTLDVAAIGRGLGVAGLAPFTLVPEAPTPPNNHFSYAMTWFGLAGALVVVFVARVRQAVLF